MIENKESLPLVSIVVPCYNHEKYVKETIDSIVNQTYKNIELIVIDDGSKDNSVEVIKKLADKYNFTFIYRSNKGLSSTLNEGLSIAKGKYFSTVASDDILMLNKIEKQVKFMESNKNENFAGIFGYVKIITDNGNESDNINLKKEIYDFSQIFYHKFLLPAPTNFFKKDILIDLDGFDEDTILEDWSLYLKLTYNGYKLVRLPEILASYRRHNTNITNDIKRMDLARKSTINKYSHVKGYNKVLARLEFITFVHYLKKYDLRCIFYFILFIFKKIKLL
jgi:alpha-1,3-rhamnosyltransferase